MAEYRTVTVSAAVSDPACIAVATVSPSAISAVASVSANIRLTDYPDYAGAYTVTPSAEAQTLPTAETLLNSNIIISPIPSTYGLVTWDGVTLTVS